MIGEEHKKKKETWAELTPNVRASVHDALSISVIHHWDVFITMNHITLLCCVYTGETSHNQTKKRCHTWIQTTVQCMRIFFLPIVALKPMLHSHHSMNCTMSVLQVWCSSQAQFCRTLLNSNSIKKNNVLSQILRYDVEGKATMQRKSTLLLSEDISV